MPYNIKFFSKVIVSVYIPASNILIILFVSHGQTVVKLIFVSLVDEKW